jgi:hypothetical protein
MIMLGSHTFRPKGLRFFKPFPKASDARCDPSDGRAGQRVQRRLEIVHRLKV